MTKTTGKNKEKRFKQLGLRGTLLDEKILDLGTALDAARKGVILASRNNFCLNASLEEARRVILANGREVPSK